MSIVIPENLIPTQVDMFALLSIRWKYGEGTCLFSPYFWSFSAWIDENYKKLHGNPRSQARQVLFSKPVFQGYCSVTRERHVWMFPIPNMVKTIEVYFVVTDRLWGQEVEILSESTCGLHLGKLVQQINKETIGVCRPHKPVAGPVILVPNVSLFPAQRSKKKHSKMTVVGHYQKWGQECLISSCVFRTQTLSGSAITLTKRREKNEANIKPYWTTLAQ